MQATRKDFDLPECKNPSFREGFQAENFVTDYFTVVVSVIFGADVSIFITAVSTVAGTLVTGKVSVVVSSACVLSLHAANEAAMTRTANNFFIVKLLVELVKAAKVIGLLIYPNFTETDTILNNYIIFGWSSTIQANVYYGDNKCQQ